jgi:predicted acetyltransferase
MEVEVRTITDDEVAAWVHALDVGFNSHVRDGEVDVRRSGLALDRTHAAFVEGNIVGTARSFGTQLTVPGGALVPAGAVTNVAVVPTHRRRGVLTEMMQIQLDDIAARSEPVAILIAAEAPIYGRFGYGAATVHTTLKIDTAKARLVERPPAADALRMVDNAELRKVGPPIYERYRRAQPGAIGRDDRWWDLWTGVITRPGDEGPSKRFHVVCGDDGWSDYTIEEKWDTGGLPAAKVEVDELVAVTSEAYAALWWHLLSLDWVRTIEAADRPQVELLPMLLTDPRRASQTEIMDFVWTRLLDVPTALTARDYSTRDRLVIGVVDRLRPASGGRFAIESEGLGRSASCTATHDDADIVLDTGALGAAYLGGSPLYLAVEAGRAEQLTPGAVRRFDAMFLSTPIPWCNTWF